MWLVLEYKFDVTVEFFEPLLVSGAKTMSSSMSWCEASLCSSIYIYIAPAANTVENAIGCSSNDM